MHPDTKAYNDAKSPGDRAICRLLSKLIEHSLPEAENKVWHAHPVWFLAGNPIVGYSKLKDSVRRRRSALHRRRPGGRREAPALSERASFYG